MNILMVPPYAPPSKHNPSGSEGGSERFCFNLSKSLMQRGYKVHVLTSSHDNTEYEVVEGVPCRFSRNWWQMLKVNPLAFIYDKLPHEVDWADVVHVHSYIYFMGCQVALYRKKRRFPFILHLHGGTAPITWKVYGHKSVAAKIVYDASLGKWGMRTADAIMSCSHADAYNAVNRFGVDPARVVQIPNSIFVDDFYSNPENPPIITFLARLVHLKGCYLIPDIIRRVHQKRGDAKFWIIGKGYAESYLKENLRGLPVYFQRSVPYSEVMDVFAKSSVSYLPSYTEGTPLTVLESLAARVPVVASNVGGIPEIVQDGETGYLTEVEDTKEMAEKIVYLLNNEEERRAMGLKGRKFVKEHHDWGATTKKIEDVYRRFLKRV